MRTSPAFDVTVAELDPAGHHCTIWVRGEVDAVTVDVLAAVIDCQHDSGRRFVQLDLSGVTFLSAGALGLFVRTHRELQRRQGALVLDGVGPRIARLLHITGLDTVLDAAGPVELAAASARRTPVIPAANRCDSSGRQVAGRAARAAL
ncbi:MAG TPA: STAS domain-containing protein [Jatrophihabitantaceae bacterium]|jgi:anti-anti-sigma factor|nr:STAS domain-containing protein [Jatrophihabitantaceae bacterium]